MTELALIEERVRDDLEYIRGWSFWLDIWFSLKTAVQVIFPPKSAYFLSTAGFPSHGRKSAMIWLFLIARALSRLNRYCLGSW